jgi:CubicO group peptidase (beta-lactamase class C family)
MFFYRASRRLSQRIFCFFLAALPLSGWALDPAPVPPPVDWKAAIEPFRVRVEKIVAAKHLPAFQIAVARDKKIIWSEVFHDTMKTTATTQTRFRIASISKCITGTLLLKLVEEGRIDLDKPITAYFPNDVPQADQMTARLLAGHLAGIRHYQGNEMVNYKHYNSLQEGLAIFDKSPLLWPPGTKFFYSSFGFNLLACALEAVTHEDFPKLAQEQVLQPLGMSHTEVDDLTHPLANVVDTYIMEKNGAVVRIKPSDDSYKWPSGGYLANAEDLLLLGDAYLDPGYLSAASIKLAETQQTTTSGKKVPYSIGWFVRVEASGNTVIYHTGEAVGGEGLLVVNPAKRTVFAALWNVSRADINSDVSAMAHDIAEVK